MQLGYFLYVSELPASPKKEPQSLEIKFSGSQVIYKVTCKFRTENVPSAYQHL